MKPMPQVALLIEMAGVQGQDLLRGITRYQRAHGPWSIIFRSQGRYEPPPRWLRRWRGDGILARVNSRNLANAIQRLGVSVVDLPYTIEGFGFPSLYTDNREVTRLAARHLLERGFRHFGFCGWPRGENSRMDERCDLFLYWIEQAGYGCDVFRARRGAREAGAWESEHEEIAAWIAGLPRPLGVMACYDDRGQHVLAACQRAGVQVPDEVAVIGADNDEVLCSLSSPPLSSIHSGFDRVGYAAAELLDQLMSGKKPPAGPILVPPLHVVPRESTDVLAMQDREVAAALRFIREHAGGGITVADVLRQVPLSRSMLDRRMKKVIGRTPKAEIIHVQLERVKQLLAETDLSLAAIAARVGYKYPQHLAALIRLKLGQTPGAYRRAARR